MAVWISEIDAIERDFRRKTTFKSKPQKKLEIISLSFLFIVLFSQLCIRLAITETSYAIEKIRGETVIADGMLRERKAELAKKRAPKALSTLANKRLGMIEGTRVSMKKIFN